MSVVDPEFAAVCIYSLLHVHSTSSTAPSWPFPHPAPSHGSHRVSQAIAAGPHQEPLPEEDKDNLYAFRANRAAHLARLRHLYRIPGEVPEVAERMAKVPMRDGHEIDVKIYNPKSPPKQGSPLVVMFHEGGWCMGDLTDEDLNCRMFVRDLGCVCVNVDYR